MTHVIKRAADGAERVEFFNDDGLKLGEAIHTPAGLMVWGRDLGYDDDTNLIFLNTADDFDGAAKLIKENEPGETVEFVTPNKTWNVPPEALREIAADLITAAIEGGTGYWAEVSSYHWGSPATGHGDGRPWSDTDVTYANVTIHETESHDDGPAKVKKVDVEQMIELIRKVVAGEFKDFYSQSYKATCRERLVILLDQLDRGMLLKYARNDFDSDDADNLMQIAVLGEIVYS